MIRVEDLVKHFGRTRAVDGISFDVERGEIVGFLGPNGAGKTTTLHYATNLDNAANGAFRTAYQKAFGKAADVFAVQGFDTGSLLIQAMAAVGGDTGATQDLIAAMEGATIADSPRGAWSMSKAHNPIQDIYLRQVKASVNEVLGVAAKALQDPATGCKMA